jgi:hypothetical protein
MNKKINVLNPLLEFCAVSEQLKFYDLCEALKR